MQVRESIEKLRNGIVRDFALGILASAVMVASSQLCIFPLLARIYDANAYGLILTVAAVGNVFVAVFGASLNNVRLVMESEYEEEGCAGDFIPLLLILSIIGTALCKVYLVGVVGISAITDILLLGFVLCGIIRTYGIAAFQIKIDFFRNLILSLLTALGNVIGCLIVFLMHNEKIWPLAFLLGQIAGVMYISQKSNIFYEPFVFTRLFWKTTRKEAVLILTTFCSQILGYLDRFLLYPLLGGSAVAAYVVASFFGKCLGLVVNPIGSVLLSYYSNKKYGMNRRKLWRNNFIVIVLAMGFMLFSFAFSEMGTSWLYPSLIDNAKPYLVVANLAAVVNVVGNMIQPVVLKFASTPWLVGNQIFYMTIYFGLGLFMIKIDGLMGFSYAALIASMVRVVFLCCAAHLSIGE